MKNKKILFLILVPILILGIVISCVKKDKNDPKSDTIIEGKTTILVDETLMPIVEDQVTIFETQYDAKITLLPKSEKESVIDFVNEKVTEFVDQGNQCVVKTESENYTCNKVFNSIYDPTIVKSQSKYPLLQQHFRGWFIKSTQAVFDENTAVFMDFSIEQKGNTRFMYVLPTSSTEALLEYTLFSKDLLPLEEYEVEIEKYIKNLGISEYEIIEKEQGNIPMTSYQFWKQNTKNIVHIGSAGGWTKASTGYTFKNSIKKSKELVRFLSKQDDFTKYYKKDKFWVYDVFFLDVLFRRNDLGFNVFSALFKNGNPTLIFKFLDEETSFWEDLQVIWKCPKGLFVRALIGRIFKF